MKVIQRSVMLVAVFAHLLAISPVRGGAIPLQQILSNRIEEIGVTETPKQEHEARQARAVVQKIKSNSERSTQDTLVSMLGSAFGLDPALTKNVVNVLGSVGSSLMSNQPQQSQYVQPVGQNPHFEGVPEQAATVDPYFNGIRDSCFTGNLLNCVIYQVLSYVGDLLDQSHYDINNEVKVVKLPTDAIKRIDEADYELADKTTPNDSKAYQFMQFMVRKFENFIRSYGFEFTIPSKMTTLSNRLIVKFLEMWGVKLPQEPFLENRNNLISRNPARPLFIPMMAIIKPVKVAFAMMLPFVAKTTVFKKFAAVGTVFVPLLLGATMLYRALTQSFYQTPPHQDDYYDNEDYIPNDYHQSQIGAPNNQDYPPYYNNNKVLDVDHNGVPTSGYDSIAEDEYDNEVRRSAKERRAGHSSPRKVNTRR